MIVKCQEPDCETALWIDGATFALGHRVLCLPCLADKAFGDGTSDVKPVYAVQSNTTPVSPSTTPTDKTDSSTSSLPTNPTTAITCPGIGAPGDAFYVPSHGATWHYPSQRDPWRNALCQECYATTLRMRSALR